MRHIIPIVTALALAAAPLPVAAQQPGGAGGGEVRPPAGGLGGPGGPGEGAQRPQAPGGGGQGAQRPAQGEPRPDQGGQRTGEGERKPQQGEGRPGQAEQKPAPGEPKPGQAEQKPLPGEKTPQGEKPSRAGEGGQRPGQGGAGEGKPAAGGQGERRPKPAAIRPEQRTRVTADIRRLNVRTVQAAEVGVRVAVGSVIPRRAVLAPLPAEIVTIVPEFRGYLFVETPADLVIVDPDTLEIVEVIPL